MGTSEHRRRKKLQETRDINPTSLDSSVRAPGTLRRSYNSSEQKIHHSLVYTTFPDLRLQTQQYETNFYWSITRSALYLDASASLSGSSLRLHPSYPHTAGLPSLQLQRQDTEQLGTGHRNEGGRGTDGEWNNTPRFYGSATDEENLSTVPSLSNTELYKENTHSPAFS